jgi:predicted phosphodiesterase
MFEGRLAVISDVHGNRWALEAVLEDIERRGVQQIVNLGDSLYGPLDPVGTARVLLELGLPTVCGNEDRIIVEAANKSSDSPVLSYVRDSLGVEHLEWLDGLQPTLVAYEGFRLCHGTLERDDEYLLREVRQEGVFLRSPDDLGAKVASLAEPVLLCGHDHVPRTVQLPNGKLIVNPGSVGAPAFADDVPFPHVMETGSPHARYSVVSRSSAAWQVQEITVPYDWQAAADTACANGQADWAEWLQTGRAALP